MKLIPRNFIKFIHKVRTEQRGAETPEWIALAAVILIILLAASFVFDAQGTSIGQNIFDQVGCKINTWTDGNGCGSNGVANNPNARTDGKDSISDSAGITQPVSTENSAGSNTGGVKPPDIISIDGIDDDSSLDWSDVTDSSAWKHGGDFVEGVFVHGLWGDITGTVTMAWDGAVAIPVLGHGLDRAGLADRDATIDKYADIWGHVKERGVGNTLWDMTLGEPVEMWQNGNPGGALGVLAYNGLSIFSPVDELGKLSKITKIERTLPGGTKQVAFLVKKATPDELTTLIARTEALTPDELADLRRGIDALSDVELEELHMLLREKSPEELVEMDLDVDDLKQVGICSFSANTPVTTMAGLRPISQLAVGEMVLAFDEYEDKVGYYPVTATWVHEDPLIVTVTIDGERIETTPGHPFYVDGEWIFARDLWVGARVADGNSGSGMIEQIEILPQAQMMYNLTVEQAHTYYVGSGQWLVHNTGDCPISKSVAAAQQQIKTFLETGLTPRFQKAIGSQLGDGNYFSIRGARLKSSVFLENVYDPKTVELSNTEDVVKGISKFGVHIDAGIRTAPNGIRQLSDVDLGWVFDSSTGKFFTNKQSLDLRDEVNKIYPTRTTEGIITHGDQYNGVKMGEPGIEAKHLVEETYVFKIIDGVAVYQYKAPWQETVDKMKGQAKMSAP